MPDRQVWNVLLIEHSPEDVQIFERAIASHPQLAVRLRVVGQVEEAISILERDDEPVPSLILFNSRSPNVMEPGTVDAFQVLRRTTPSPVLFFCASAEKTDIEKAYRGLASSYCVIPKDSQRFKALVRKALEYWVTRVQLPPPPDPRIAGAVGGDFTR